MIVFESTYLSFFGATAQDKTEALDTAVIFNGAKSMERMDDGHDGQGVIERWRGEGVRHGRRVTITISFHA